MITAENYRINEISRFLILLGGLSASVCICTVYGFNILSNRMVELFNFGGTDLTTISTVGVVVGYFTFPGGMLLDYAGPMWVCIMALVFNALGVLLYALSFEGVIAGSVLKFSVFSAIMHFGCLSFDTGSLMAVLGSFPLTKGPVVALLKTFTGLGASILAIINYSFFRTAYSHYMYFMMGLVIFMGGFACIFIRFPPYHIIEWEKTRVPERMLVRRRLTERAYLTQYPPMIRFYIGMVVISSIVIYLTVQSFCVAYANPSDSARMGNTIMIIIFVFCFTIMVLPFRFLGGMDEEPSKDLPDYPEDEQEGTGNKIVPREFEEGGEPRGPKPTEVELALDETVMKELYGSQEPGDRQAAGDDREGYAETTTAARAEDGATPVEDENLALMMLSDQDPQYQTTFLESLRNPDIWLCCWNTLATWGCGVVIAFNSAQIYRSLANDVYETKTNTMYSAIISVASALGRMSMGVFELILSRQPSETRPPVTVVFPIPSICMVLGLTFLVALPLGSKGIVVGFFFDSFGNGFSWACTALTVRSVFAKDIGKHYSFMYVGAVIAVIALNRFGYGEMYDRQAKKNRDADIAAGRTPIYPRCAGKKCSDYSMIILLCVNASAIIGSTWFHLRYRSFVLRKRAERAAELENRRRAQEDESSAEPFTERQQ
ncbi:hypothetical protein NESM_000290200 [Novymonas esmeraldas]|uniref:Uncharacterized protein n=1 Tax=Novymonas esmeraldas TaxID=1808958 RepID=A0AAW0F9J3_9TRYP